MTRLKVAYDFRRECLVSASYFEHLRACINKMNAELEEVVNSAVTTKMAFANDEMKLLLEAGYKPDDIVVVFEEPNSTQTKSEQVTQESAGNVGEKQQVCEIVDTVGFISKEEDDDEEHHYEEDFHMEEVGSISPKPECIEYIETVKSSYMCLECNKEFSTKEALTNHMATHDENVNPLENSSCEGKLPEKDNMEAQILAETVQSEYMCDVCGKAYENEDSLACHMETHQDKTAHECEICKKKFSSKDKLMVNGYLAIYACWYFITKLKWKILFLFSNT